MLGIRRRTLGWIAISSAVVTAFAAACGGSSATIASSDGGADGSSGSDSSVGPGTDSGGTSTDSGFDEDGGTVTDGGSNLNPEGGDDAGETLDGSLPDGGTCNTIANGATSVASTCSSAIPILGGGNLSAGTYYLTAVEALATPVFCAGTFKSDNLKETLMLAVTGGVGSVDFVVDIDGIAIRRSTATITPTGMNKSPATIAESCPTSASGTSEYASSNMGGTTTLKIRLPYGSGEGIYTFTKQ